MMQASHEEETFKRYVLPLRQWLKNEGITDVCMWLCATYSDEWEVSDINVKDVEGCYRSSYGTNIHTKSIPWAGYQYPIKVHAILDDLAALILESYSYEWPGEYGGEGKIEFNVNDAKVEVDLTNYVRTEESVVFNENYFGVEEIDLTETV